MYVAKNSTVLNISFRVSVDHHMLAVYALDMLSEYDNPLDLLLSANKRQIFLLAKHNLIRSGRLTAFERVPKKFTYEQLKQAEQHVISLFPEIGEKQ